MTSIFKTLLLAASCALLHACASHAPKALPASAGPPPAEAPAPAPIAGLIQAPAHDGLFLPRSVEEAPQKPASSARRRPPPPANDGPVETTPARLGLENRIAPRLESPERLGGTPYGSLDQDYTPAQGLRAYRTKGTASWYGKRFHGGRTSSGEPFDMFAMSAAHPSLPIPSYARVTNLANGRSVVVRVNDRGPFHSNRIMDLSYAAAHKLGFVDRGMAEIEVEQVIPPAGAAALTVAKNKPAKPSTLAQAPAGSTPPQADPIYLLPQPARNARKLSPWQRAKARCLPRPVAPQAKAAATPKESFSNWGCSPTRNTQSLCAVWS